MHQALFNWSGGKDSGLALYHVLKDKRFDIKKLMTTVNAEVERISMHGVHKTLLERQVEAIGIPLSIISLPGEINMADYDQLMKNVLNKASAEGITHSVFGDIFLEDLKSYREERLKEVGMSAHFPLWKRSTSELVKEFLSLGFRTMVVAIDGSKLDKSFVGRELDMDFVNDLPKGVDPCGENGEFHSYVFDGPIFKHPVPFEIGEVVKKEYKLSKDNPNDTVTYWFQDLK